MILNAGETPESAAATALVLLRDAGYPAAAGGDPAMQAVMAAYSPAASDGANIEALTAAFRTATGYQAPGDPAPAVQDQPLEKDGIPTWAWIVAGGLAFWLFVHEKAERLARAK